ncbi:MAG TPA: patatin-like phospholipase family protein [Thermoanaerobaculia bacterium]|jgi:predicted acylesterase/phospholipase RssA|nr:patatin-like phospholipase family protein [Thermoanaerobaculia bacterium]
MQPSPKIGLALAGGGPEGAIYEIGVLRALDEALEGVDLTHLHVYVGVSAGAFINANLANNITTAQMCRAIVSEEPGEHPFVPETFLSPAFGEIARRGLMLPGLLARALGDYVANFRQRTLLESLFQLSQALPVAVFDNARIREYLEKIYNIKGRTDDFRRLGKHLVVVAADLDSGQAVRFGEPGFDHVPISQAVQASGALPGLYAPVEIDGRFYVDGVLLKTLHASVALEAGANLVICVNPIVPVDTVRAVEAGMMQRGNLLHRGLPSVMSQTFRTMIHSRMEVGMAAYQTKFKDADVVLIQPERDDYLMFFTNIFGFAERRTVAEHAYTSTRRYLLRNVERLEPVFARHGIKLRRDVLEQERDLWTGVWEGRKTRERHSRNETVRELDDVLSRLEALVDDRLAGESR